jgi:hypothetical protein
MTRIFKQLLKRCWVASFPIRRPFQHRFEAYMRRLVGNAGLPGVEVVLHHMLREQAILRAEVERLSELLEDRREAEHTPFRERRAG